MTEVIERGALRITCLSRAEQANAWADRVAVAVVVDNLLSNAVKYSPRGKPITVTVRAERGTVVCDVRDEGPGLSVEDQAKLFQRGGGASVACRPRAK